MYNVLDISKYVINYSHDIGASITNLKLQKILYYIQAAFLVNKQEKCFAEPIVAWEFGPVSVETYNQYKCYGREEIPRQEPREEVEFDEEKFVIVSKKVDIDSQLKNNDKKIIKKVVDSYQNVKDPFELVEKTHKEDPWIETGRNDIISIEKIKRYYKENTEKIYG